MLEMGFMEGFYLGEAEMSWLFFCLGPGWGASSQSGSSIAGNLS